MSEEHDELAERMAMVLSDHGMQRMTARVLGVFLVTEQETLTQREVAAQLRAGAGSVSSAINTLIGTGQLERVPAPGSRREHYRLRDDAWPALFSRQNEAVSALWTAVRQALEDTEPGTRARWRLQEMHDFYAFVFAQLPEMLERWRRIRSAADSDPQGTAGDRSDRRNG